MKIPASSATGTGARFSTASKVILFLGVCGAVLCWQSVQRGAYSQYGNDFSIFVKAASLFHQGISPYDLSNYRQHLAFFYPPEALLVFLPFALMPEWLAHASWFWLNYILLFAGLYYTHTGLLQKDGERFDWKLLAVLFVIFFDVAQNNFHNGQANILPLSATLFFIYFLRKGRETIAAALLAVACMKIAPAVLCAVLLFERRFTCFAKTIGFAVLFNLLPFALFGGLGELADTISHFGANLMAILPPSAPGPWYEALYMPVTGISLAICLYLAWRESKGGLIGAQTIFLFFPVMMMASKYKLQTHYLIWLLPLLYLFLSGETAAGWRRFIMRPQFVPFFLIALGLTALKNRIPDDAVFRLVLFITLCNAFVLMLWFRLRGDTEK